jgi:hypothetical protein
LAEEEWMPHGRRRIEKPQQEWKNQVTDMRSRNMEEVMTEDRLLGFWEWIAL